MQSVLDESSDTTKVNDIPCAASTILYNTSAITNIAVELALAGEATAKLDKKVLSAQMRGYSSKDDLRELGLPLWSLDDDKDVTEMSQTNERYKLLKEIWHK